MKLTLATFTSSRRSLGSNTRTPEATRTKFKAKFADNKEA